MSTNREDVRDFLVSRRARVRPEQVGLPGGPNRRVAGLRRGEVAMLADVSVEYYSRLERGSLAGVSDGVLHAVAGALLLDDAERDHLFDLARAANASPVRGQRRAATPKALRVGLQYTLDSFTGGPAFIRNDRLDVLGANALGRALYADLFRKSERPNLARAAFLDRDWAEAFHPDWDLAADQSVAILRAAAGHDPHDEDLQALVGELSTRSPEFRAKWGVHDVRRHATGEKHFVHPVVGALDLHFEGTRLMSDPGLSLLLYSAEPGSPTADALRLLGSVAATDRCDAVDAAGRGATDRR
ncbi:helix-turn-helix transcriptional regulator [Curtobacterium sp. VKM Ac-2852]|uniref:helix-turn-helix transcriptional regulator n=1 Tax=Curtobacterium sp. VKM Ac-2852 TaxID=2739024 RepID=UPI001566D070|nr:helix-turn-helix transcriptional regulator [Curtobacterium sp. VKM Ac-2852]NQX22826.1 helix-turn-helix domain-containing protein [Curtobacterium sp. VKM Ac-2852]